MKKICYIHNLCIGLCVHALARSQGVNMKAHLFTVHSFFCLFLRILSYSFYVWLRQTILLYNMYKRIHHYTFESYKLRYLIRRNQTELGICRKYAVQYLNRLFTPSDQYNSCSYITNTCLLIVKTKLIQPPLKSCKLPSN